MKVAQRLIPYAYATPLLFAVGCGGAAAGTKPHDMSTAQHEAAAKHEEAASRGDAPGAASCSQPVCWGSTAGQNAPDDEQARHHMELAEQHRAAAQALRDAEASACVGIEPSDRATSPFYHRQDIVSVSKVELPVQEGQDVATQFAGGQAVFRAVPGLTVEWLQRLVDCHQARAASVGYAMPEMSYCPLMLKDVKATVSSVHGGFAVAIASNDPETSAEIWRRLSALHPQ